MVFIPLEIGRGQVRVAASDLINTNNSDVRANNKFRASAISNGIHEGSVHSNSRAVKRA